MEKVSKNKLQVVEYREGPKVIRLFLRRRQNPGPTAGGEVKGLRYYRKDPGPIYQVFFQAGGRQHCHEYPFHEVARSEEEYPLKEG